MQKGVEVLDGWRERVWSPPAQVHQAKWVGGRGCKRVFQVEELLLETKFTGLSQRGHEAGDKVAKGEGAEMTRAR